MNLKQKHIRFIINTTIYKYIYKQENLRVYKLFLFSKIVLQQAFIIC